MSSVRYYSITITTILIYMKHYIFLLALLFSSLALAEERNWTSADGSKKIQATFIEYEEANDIVVIKNKNKEQRVKLSLFSEEDRKWVKSHETTDDPFGDSSSKETKKSRKPIVPIDLDLLCQKAEASIKEIKNVPAKPLAYANLGIIQSLSGKKDQANQSFNEAIKLAKKSGDRANFFLFRIGIAATDAGCLDHALQCVDTIPASYGWYNELVGPVAAAFAKIGDKKTSDDLFDRALKSIEENDGKKKNKSMHLRYIAMNCAKIGDFEKALSVAAQSNQQDVLTLVFIGKGYLDVGKESEAREYFTLAEETTPHDNFLVPITKFWIDANRLDEARSMLNKIKEKPFKASILREIAFREYLNGNRRKTERTIADALAVKEESFLLYNERFVIEMFLHAIGEEKEALASKQKAIREIYEITDKLKKFKILAEYTFYQYLLGDDAQYNKFIDEVKNVDLSQEQDQEAASRLWLTIAANFDLIGEANLASEFFTKAKRQSLRIKDNSKKEQLANIFSKPLNNNTLWSKMPSILYDNRIVGPLSMLRVVTNTLVVTGQNDDLMAFVDKIKLPEAKVYVIRLVAEEVKNNK